MSRQPTDTIFFKHKLSRNVFFEDKYPFEAWMFDGDAGFHCVWRKNARTIYKFLTISIYKDRPRFIFLKRVMKTTNDPDIYMADYYVVVCEYAHDSFREISNSTILIQDHRENIKEYHDDYLNAKVISTHPYNAFIKSGYERALESVWNNAYQSGVACFLDYRADKSKLKYGNLLAYVSPTGSGSTLLDTYYIGQSNHQDISSCIFDTFDELEYIAKFDSSLYLISIGASRAYTQNESISYDINSHIALFYTGKIGNAYQPIIICENFSNADFKSQVGSKCLIGRSTVRESQYLTRAHRYFLGKNSSGDVHMYDLRWYTTTSITISNLLHRIQFIDLGSTAYVSFISDIMHFGFFKSGNGTLSQVDAEGNVYGTISGSSELSDNLMYLYSSEEFGAADFGNRRDLLITQKTSDLSELTIDQYDAGEEDEVQVFSGALMYEEYMAVTGDSYSRAKPHIGMCNGGDIDWLDSYVPTDYFTEITTNVVDDSFDVSLDFTNAVVNGGTIITGSIGYISSDYGTTWSPLNVFSNAGVQISISASPPNIAYGNGIYLCCGTYIYDDPDQGRIYKYYAFTSSDGYNWIANEITTRIMDYSLYFINGYFISLYNTSRIYRSTNGINWQTQDWPYGSDPGPSIGAFISANEFTSASVVNPSSGNPYILKYSVSNTGIISVSGRINCSESEIGINLPSGSWIYYNNTPIRLSGCYIDDDGILRKQIGIGYEYTTELYNQNEFCIFDDRLFVVDKNDRAGILFTSDGIDFDILFASNNKFEDVTASTPNINYDSILVKSGDKLLLLVSRSYAFYGRHNSIYKFELISESI